MEKGIVKTKHPIYKGAFLFGFCKSIVTEPQSYLYTKLRNDMSAVTHRYMPYVFVTGSLNSGISGVKNVNTTNKIAIPVSIGKTIF